MKSPVMLTGFLFIFVTASGFAKTITINSKVTCDANQLTATLSNQGDEQANDVSVEIFDGDRKLLSEKPTNIPAGGSIVQTFTLGSLPKEGTFANRMLISYRDAGGYLFSAPSVFMRRAGSGGNSKLSIRMDAPSVTGKEGSITLINTEKVPLDVKVDMFAANELRITPDQIKQPLGPGESKTVTFTISNLSALNMSRYPFFSIVNYELDKVNYAAIGNSQILVRQTSGAYRLLSALFASIVCIGGFIIARRILFAKGRKQT
jgi:hypothetical protein